MKWNGNVCNINIDTDQTIFFIQTQRNNKRCQWSWINTNLYCCTNKSFEKWNVWIWWNHMCAVATLNYMLLVPFNMHTPTAIADIYLTLWNHIFNILHVPPRMNDHHTTVRTLKNIRWTFFFHFEKKTNSCAMWTRSLHSRTNMHFYVLDVIKINVGKEISKCTAVSTYMIYV